VTAGRITLLTRAFGRGTDFICYDDRLQQNGGIHVIQTFFSFIKSEEVQIKGRTARQGNVGSFSLVLMDGDLERIGVTPSVIREMTDTKNYYQILDMHRAAHFERQYLKDIAHVDEIRADHEKALVFVSNLLTMVDVDAAKDFLLHRNLYLGNEVGESSRSSRTIVLLDATGSMSACLRNAKQSVSKMFERAYDILQSEGVAGAFEMQFAAYRNYNAPPEQLLQYSPWSSRPNDLQQFLDTVSPCYGMGNEAIEIALWHVNQQHAIDPVGQVVIIGDMPPNTPEEVLHKRQERSWVGTNFDVPTDFVVELAELVRNEIKVHAFYVDSDARAAFELMSQQSGGEPNYLDVDSPQAGEELTDLVTRHILAQQGGESKGAILVAAYDAKYGRRGHVDSVL
jgi:hypothetical protein